MKNAIIFWQLKTTLQNMQYHANETEKINFVRIPDAL